MTLVFKQSHSDPELEIYRSLPAKQLSSEKGLFIAEGEILVGKLLASDFTIHSILIDENRAHHEIPDCWAELPVYVLSKAELNKLVGFQFHRGIMAAAHKKRGLQYQDYFPLKKYNWTIVVCPDLNDNTNLGLIIRNCSAFGVDALLLGRSSCDPFSRRALRVSAGSALHLPIFSCSDLKKTLRQLQQDYGVKLIASLIDKSSVPLHQVSRKNRVALLFGNEGQGLSKEISSICDIKTLIKMSPGADSLNVSVSSGIFLYHFCGEKAEAINEGVNQ